MSTTMDRTSPIPLYFQLKQVLLQQIEQGEWQPGDMIPGEQELQETFGLSRTTVRQTLAELVNEGRLHRQRGRGTFVTRPKFAHDPNVRPGAAGYLQSEGLTPGWQVISADWVAEPPEGVRERLKIDKTIRVFRVHRLRLANDEPIGYHFAYVPELFFPHLNLERLTEGGSMRYLRDVPQMHNSVTQRTIEATAANGPEIEMLGATSGEPILTIERLILADDGTPIELLWAAYFGDRFKYQVTI
ncbi:GntR family transcriptional regulator [Candidatus Leptofilum sp.]|uniref:GntR family transcriptional regulator n=1 Tax=Candidatus Leptofilum sp. TaxID=3241576 RepID=UPI003B5B0D80